MKKNRLYLVLIVILIFSMFLISVRADDAMNESEKGDLKCPDNSQKSCKEIVDTNGKVIQVDVISGSFENDGDIQVTKHVKKTNVVGKYEVWFTVKGKNIQEEKISEEVEIALILDASRTVKDNVPTIQKAANAFYNEFKTQSNVKMFASQFAKNQVIIKNWNDKKDSLSFYEYNTNGLGKTSHVEKALSALASNTSKSSSGKRYMVLLGDGQYWYSDDTDVKEAKKWFTALRNDYGFQYYMIQYGARAPEYNNGKNLNFIRDHIQPIGWYKIFEGVSYDTALNDIANIINKGITTSKKISAEIKDKLGINFSYNDSNYGESIKLIVDSITENGVDTEHFIITINDLAPNGWHPTNDGFNLNYVIDGQTKTINSNINPLVYWKEIICTDSITDEKEKVIKSCSGTESIDLEIKSNCQSEKKIYYDISCDEKITASIKINNLNDGVKKFSIDKGLGFPANLNLKTNLNCNYIFYKGLYDNDYNKLTREISKETDEKIIHSKTKKINEMKSYLETYNNYLNNLNDYKTNVFSNQAATLKVKVLDNSYDYQDFINSNFKINEDNCKDIETYQDGFKVTTKNCSLKMEKDMVLTEKCLNMKDGSVENCTNSNKQIKGGNKYYTSINKNSGSVFVEINSLGYTSVINNKSNISIKLEDCEYETGKLYKDKVSFRQIELSDPFLKSYTNSKRKIGKNYSNTRYDFVSIIKPDIWSLSTSDYKFSLSKINVSNIRHDTNNLGVSSYLGSDCYINNLNKYVCKFFEESKKNNFFTNIEK